MAPEVTWKNGEIVGIQNCERPKKNYNTQCSRIYCEHEIGIRDEVKGFMELGVVQIYSRSDAPGESNHLVEVLMPQGTIYFMCEMRRNVVEKIVRTTKNEFEFKKDL